MMILLTPVLNLLKKLFQRFQPKQKLAVSLAGMTMSAHSKKLLYFGIVFSFPHVGYFADICRQTRARYHYAVCQVKHRSDKLKAKKLANSLVNKDTKCFWKVVRHMKTNNKKVYLHV